MKKADDAIKEATGVKPSPKPGKKPETAPNNKASTGATKSTDDIIKEVMNRKADSDKGAKATADKEKIGGA